MTKYPTQTCFQISWYLILFWSFHKDIIQKLEITDKKNKHEPFTFLWNSIYKIQDYKLKKNPTLWTEPKWHTCKNKKPL